MRNLDRHEIFLPHQQMMWSNCVSQDSMQEIENTLGILNRKNFIKELIIKAFEGLEKPKKWRREEEYKGAQ